MDEVVSMESALTTSWVAGLGVRMPRKQRSFEAISSMNTTFSDSFELPLTIQLRT